MTQRISFQEASKAINMGETQLRLYSLVAWKECSYYTDKERTALAFAEALTNANQQDVDKNLFESLSGFFSRNEIADLAVAITQINSRNRINKAFRTIPGNYTPDQY